MRDESTLQRFMSKVRQGPDCWEWTASIVKEYGQFWFDGTNRRAHRISYELFVGPVPEGLRVCHRCDNPPCVNPAHLFVGTDSDNMVDKVAKGRHVSGNSKKTHCPHGHPYDDDNTIVRGGKRFCRTCDRARKHGN